MSKELVLVPKRKYEELIKRDSVKESNEESENKDINVDDEKDVNVDQGIYHNKDHINQKGNGDSNLFTKMTFDSFDRMHQKLKPKKKRTKSQWLKFEL